MSKKGGKQRGGLPRPLADNAGVVPTALSAGMYDDLLQFPFPGMPYPAPDFCNMSSGFASEFIHQGEMSMKFHRPGLFMLLICLSAGVMLAQEATPEGPKCFAFQSSANDVRISYYMGEGNAFFATGQYGSALFSFTCIIDEIDASYVPAYTSRAIVYTAQRNYDEAIEDYTAALELQPGLAAALNNRGIVYAAQGKYEEALADFGAVLSADAANTLALNNRGVIKAVTGDYDGAIADFEQAIAVSGIDDIVTILTDPERPSNAERPEYDPVNAQSYALLGIVYSAKALDNYNKYLLLRPNNADRRIQSAAGALESRFTFELRLDDGTWLLTAAFAEQ